MKGHGIKIAVAQLATEAGRRYEPGEIGEAVIAMRPNPVIKSGFCTVTLVDLLIERLFQRKRDHEDND